jgi:hypothetical protein
VNVIRHRRNLWSHAARQFISGCADQTQFLKNFISFGYQEYIRWVKEDMDNNGTTSQEDLKPSPTTPEKPLDPDTLREMSREAMKREPPPLPDSLKMRQHPPLK